MAHKTFILPLSVLSLVDLKRVKRELDDINDALLQTDIRKNEANEQSPDKLPKTSRLLDDITDANKIELLKKDEREDLTKLIESLVMKAPVIHMSFSAEPSPKFLERLMEYLRQSIDPYTLLIVGLAPSIGAGCLIRTTNHYFDLSLKQALFSHKDILMKQLSAVAAKPAPAAEPKEPEAVPA